MFGGRNVEEEIKRAQEERKRQQREAMLATRGVAFGVAQSDENDAYGVPSAAASAAAGAPRRGGSSSSSLSSPSSIFEKQEEAARNRSTAQDGFGTEFGRAVAQRYTAPQKFLEETAAVMERNVEGDVFDAYRRKTVAESEDDYHARWRRRKLSPEREDPFAAGIRAKKEKLSGRKSGSGNGAKKRTRDAENTNNSPQAHQRSYVEVMREVELERDIRDASVKLKRITEDKERLAKLRRESPPEESSGAPSADLGDARRTKYQRSNDHRGGEESSRGGARGRDRGGGRGGGGVGGRGNSQYEWGRPEVMRAEEEEKRRQRNAPVEKPNLETSGKLVEESNATTNGIILKWTPPPEIRPPTKRWRLYVLKNDEECQKPIPLHEQSYFLFGRDREVVDIPTDHPSCSKQHSVLCFRQVVVEDQFGLEQQTSIKPYMIDLTSTNGTFINGKRIDDSRYYELKEFDSLKFGESTRDYVLLHEESTREGGAK